MRSVAKPTWPAILGLAATAALGLAAPALAQPAAPLSPPPPVGQGPNGDWAFLSRYGAANATLGAGAGRIVFMGDSITEGWAKQAGFTGHANFVGRGISGQTSLQMVVRFRADVINLHPAAVHIMAGTNDIAGNTGPETDATIEDAIKSMVDLARVNRIKVIIGSIPPANHFFWHPGIEPALRIQRLNAWLRTYAATHGATYVDYWSPLADPSGGMKAGTSLDGVHPNELGYRTMMAALEAAVPDVRTKPPKPSKRSAARTAP